MSAAGSVAGRALRLRFGRAAVMMAASLASLSCSFAFGWLYAAPLWVVTLLALVYNLAAIADSSVYSTTLAEVVAPSGSARRFRCVRSPVLPPGPQVPGSSAWPSMGARLVGIRRRPGRWPGPLAHGGLAGLAHRRLRPGRWGSAEARPGRGTPVIDMKAHHLGGFHLSVKSWPRA